MTDPIPLLGFSTTLLEVLSFTLAIITVILNIRQNHWAWFFSIVSSGTYAFIFFGSKLYGDTGLQVVFILVSIWGWYQWLYGGTNHHGVEVSRLSSMAWFYSGAGWLAGFIVLALFLSSFTDTDVPYIDGFLTAGSLLGQLLLSRKKIENWLVWIVVDILYIGLYVYKGLMLTAVLYALFTVLAVIGYRSWKNSLPALPRHDSLPEAARSQP